VSPCPGKLSVFNVENGQKKKKKKKVVAGYAFLIHASPALWWPEHLIAA
jgi:hypothetical protein